MRPLHGLAALPLLALAPLAATGPPADVGRVVVLGFDGADARTVRALLADDPASYPNFARLAGEGTFEPLGIVAPPESPVSWAAINTGQNPAKTGVPGFVKRVFPAYAPEIPAAGLGHIIQGKPTPLSKLENAPLPTWDASTFALVAGLVTFAVVTLLLALLLRGKLVVAALVGLVLGGAAAFTACWARGFLPEEIPRTGNPNQARNFWDYAADAGVESLVIDAAQAFDMPAPEGAKVLAGLGVPDARGGLGEWAIYTTNELEFSRPPAGRESNTAGKVYRVDERGGEIRAHVYGPPNHWLAARRSALAKQLADPTLDPNTSLELSTEMRELDDQLRTPLAVELVVKREGDTARIRMGDEEQVLREGEWSDWFHPVFELNWLVKVHAITRVKLVHLDDPHFELFLNVLDVDPSQPPFWQPISEPFEFSAELHSACGDFETYGWPTATMPFKDGEVAPELLMEDVEFTLGWREKLTYEALTRDDWRILFSVFSTTDRVQHMMYQYFDPQHPLYVEEEALSTFTFFGEEIERRDAIPAIYRQMDRVVGEVLARLEPDDVLMVISDHGFQSFRRQVHVNNWLAREGYLVLRPCLAKSDSKELKFVDWSKTRAYSLGMGFVYVNQVDREPQGIVDPADAEALIAEIRARLLEAVDPDDPTKRIANDAYVTREIHQGRFLDDEGDLLLSFAPGYRVSWASTFGGMKVKQGDDGCYVAAPICSDNTSNWSGGHVSVALPDVAGVFLSNRKWSLPPEGVNSLQIAPTALALTGVTPPVEMDLPALALE